MGFRAIAFLTSVSGERPGLDHIVVRVGVAASYLVTALYLVIGLVTGDGLVFVRAIGPMLAAALMTAQILGGREEGGIALFGSGVIIALWYALFGDATTVVPAAVALVLVASIGMLFVDGHRAMVSTITAVALAAIPQFWGSPQGTKLILGAIMATSYLMTYLILNTIHETVTSLSTKYQILFEESPTAVLEEDWSEAIEYVRSEYVGKPERLRQFLLAYPEVVRKAVSRARVVRANEAAQDLLEITDAARFQGYRSPRVVTDLNIESFVGALVALYEGKKTWDEEILTVSRLGELRWLQARSVDTSDAARASSIVIGLTDITHVRARNEAMAELMRAKDQFVASVSHELRTPLTAVVGITSELVQGRVLDQEERAELLRLVSSQASEMENIVDDLLVAARSQIGTVAVKLQVVDLLGELKATLDGLAITVELPERNPPLVTADPRRVRQILRNLLTNALRYGGPRRRITVGTSVDRVWVEVRDDGEGIPEELAARIFEPYVTGHTGVQGSVGLGLSVARQLAELMGGSLIHSRTAGETVFRLELPAAPVRDSALASHSDTG